MKNFLLFCLMIISLKGFNQISFEFQTPLLNLIPIKLTDTETKYLDQPLYWNNQDHFTLYNLDGSFYKTIYLPPKPDTSAVVEIVCYVTRTLFDNDPSTIEYFIHYDPCDSIQSGAPWRDEIIREDGSVLLNEPYASYNGLMIYSSEQGTKMMLEYYYGNSVPYLKKIYALPGQIPTRTDENLNNVLYGFNLYPNPNNGTFYLNIKSPNGDKNTIELYTLSGELIKTFISTSQTTQINNLSLPSGIYILKATGSQGFQRKKLIIQK